MGPFDRFNDRAKRVLALAQDEAVRFNHTYIGAEHLLLGLVREGDGAAARALDALGVDLQQVRAAVESKVGRGPHRAAPSEITLAPVVKKIIELAIKEARALGHTHVGTEHLLMGLVREGESAATKVLDSLGVTSERLRAQLIATMGANPAPPAATARMPRPRFGRGRTEQVLTVARDEALALGHDWIGTEHLLLALLRPAFPFTLRPLAAIGITYDKALPEIVTVVPRKDGRPANASLTPRTYSVMGYAKGYAELTHGVDGSRALLVALVADQDGVAGQLLTKLGATAEKVFDAMEQN